MRQFLTIAGLGLLALIAVIGGRDSLFNRAAKTGWPSTNELLSWGALWLILTLLAGCATNEQKIAGILDEWLGAHQSELISQWGPPDRTTSDGADGKILVYRKTFVAQRPGMATAPHGVLLYTAPQDVVTGETTQFYANSAGILYRWRWARD